jgi:hypothetical protein
MVSLISCLDLLNQPTPAGGLDRPSSLCSNLLCESNVQCYQDFAANIANINGGGATKTTIMYKAMLSYEYMKEYLLSLVQDDNRI